MKINELLEESNDLERKYENHFKTKFPENIIGWWNPVNISEYNDELKRGVNQMRIDINNAIQTNTPIEEIPDEEFKKIIF